MHIVASGLTDRACRAILGPLETAGHSLRWLDPDQFIAALKTHDAARNPEHMVWLYRAPWSRATLSDAAIDQADPAQLLATWLNDNRALLNARADYGSAVLLVNADRIHLPDLAALLDDPGSRASVQGRPVPEKPATDALPKVFELAASQYWEVFEALEAAAWTSGDSPLFRGMYDVEEFALHEALKVRIEALGLPGIRSELATVAADRDKIAADAAAIRAARDQTSKELQLSQSALAEARTAGMQATNNLEAVKAELAQEKSAREEAATESELLLVQLHQVQEELEQYYLKGLDTEKLLGSTRKAAADANEKLKAVQAQARTTSEQAQRKLAAAQKEIEALKLKLGQLQKELATAAQPPVTSLATVNGETRHVWWKGDRALPKPLRRTVVRVRERQSRKAQAHRLMQSGWFSPEWYLDTYPDLRKTRVDPAMHYLMFGWKESRNPCPGFDTAYYLKAYPDVRESGVNPLWHYLEHGSKEGRLPRKP